MNRADLLHLLRAPQAAHTLTEPDWSSLVATARDANLLGALAVVLHQAGAKPPQVAERHLAGMRQLGERQRLSVGWEVQQLQSALGSLGVPVVLLKGSAYVMAYPEVAAGRLFGDIDILVPRAALGDVESRLMLSGWVSAKPDEYDQRYYRQWMHELPPMTHLQRGTVLDVHHTILPLTSRAAPDPASIMARALPLAGLQAVFAPCPEDLLIHSITHLMHEGELNNGLRDLHDVDRMVALFGQRSGFWQRLGEIAVGNDLARHVALGLRLLQRLYGTRLPADLLPVLEGESVRHGGDERLLRLYETALLSPFGGRIGAAAGLARQLIYLRAHRLRMPAAMLARHLTIKAWKGLTTPEPKAGT